MERSRPTTTLFVVWRPGRLSSPPNVDVPPGYQLRVYRESDEPRWLALVESVGWDMDEGLFDSYMPGLLPRGLFVAEDASTGNLVATAGAVHNTRDGMFPFGGEVGNVAVRERETGKGLGRAVTAAATARLIDTGYTSIRIAVGPDPRTAGAKADNNLPALATYLKMGYRPFVYAGAPETRWRAISAHFDLGIHEGEWVRSRPDWDTDEELTDG